MSISYTKTVWKAGREGGTAWTPARLNNMESGIEQATDEINDIEDSITTIGNALGVTYRDITVTATGSAISINSLISGIGFNNILNATCFSGNNCCPKIYYYNGVMIMRLYQANNTEITSGTYTVRIWYASKISDIITLAE